MLVVMMILLLWPALALFVVVIALAAGTWMIRCWIPWCCRRSAARCAPSSSGDLVNALLVASNATFVCIAVDKVNGAAAFVDNALYRQAQADITEFAKAEAVGSARVGAGPAATAVAAQGPWWRSHRSRKPIPSAQAWCRSQPQTADGAPTPRRPCSAAAGRPHRPSRGAADRAPGAVVQVAVPP